MNLEDLFSKQSKVVEFKYEPIFAPILQKQMEKDNLTVIEPSDVPAFRASSLGYCQRSVLYKLRGYPERRTFQEVLTLNVGTAVHEVLQAYIEKTGVLKSMEDKVRVTEIRNTTGHYDGLLEINGERMLLEIKTQNVEAFQRMVLNPAPYAKHKRQATFYMKALGVTKVIFLYVNKNTKLLDDFAKEHPGANPVFVEIAYTLEEALHELNVKEIDELIDHHKNGTQPQYKSVGQCSYCAFRQACLEDNEREKVERREAKKAATAKAKADAKLEAAKVILEAELKDKETT